MKALISLFCLAALVRSQSIFELGRTKREAKIGNFFRILGNAYRAIYGTPRKTGSLGDLDDLPTEIREGAASYTPMVENPLIRQMDADARRREEARRSGAIGRKKYKSYKASVKIQPKGYRYKENIRKQDVPGCGVPLCTIIDMRIKSFKSMCDLVEWMTENGKYRTVLEIQKGSCENASKSVFITVF